MSEYIHKDALEHDQEAIRAILEGGYTETSKDQLKGFVPLYNPLSFSRTLINNTGRAFAVSLAADDGADVSDGFTIINGMQQEERRRRDFQILQASHKRLMMGCLETMYRRKLKNSKELENIEESK